MKADNKKSVEQSGILSAEDVYEVIESRISYFKEIYHKYEAIQLNNALHVIKNLIPPKQFEGKELPEEELRKVVEELKGQNPYPESVFIPIPDEKMDAVVKLLKDNGYSSDSLYGNWGRYIYKKCIEVIELCLKNR